MIVRTVCRAKEKCLEKYKNILKYKEQLAKQDQKENETTSNNKDTSSSVPKPSNFRKTKVQNQYNRVFSIDEKVAEYEKILNDKVNMIDAIFNKAEKIRDLFIGTEPLTKELIKNELQYGAIVLNRASDLILAFADNNEPREPEFVLNTDMIVNDLKPLLHPTRIFDYSSFGFDDVNKLAINPKIRYLPNWSINYIRKCIQSFFTSNSNIEVQNLHNYSNHYDNRIYEHAMPNDVKLQILIGLDKMFNKLSIQHRFGTFETQILSCFFMKQKICEYEAYMHLPDCVNKSKKLKKGTETVCWQYLAEIIKHYEGIPFYHHTHSSKFGALDNTKISITTNKEVSCCLPSVMHGLLNGIIGELLCDLSTETALIYAKHLMNCSATSTYQRQLEFKDSFRMWPKLCYDSIGYALAVLYSKDMKPLEHRVEKIDSEFWFDEEEKDKLSSSLSKIPSYMKPFVNNAIQNCKKRGDYINQMICDINKIKLSREPNKFETHDLYLESGKNTEYLRWLTMTSTIISNFGIYNKTSLLLEYEKSISTKTKVMVQQPEPKVSLITEQGLQTPILHDWTKVPVLNEMSSLFDSEWKSTLVKEFEDINDFEKRFVTFLTNKSGGIKSEEPTLSKELKGISNARIIAFALNRNDYQIESKFLNMLIAHGKCAIRFQIDRRARVIVIVPNAIQSSELFLLLGFNVLKSDKRFNEKIAVGKQIGNLLDAKAQMISSGDVLSVKNSSDMKGMDAHTLPNLTLFLRRKMIEVLYELDPTGKCARYFFAEDKEYCLIQHHEKYHEQFVRRLRGPTIHAAKCLYYMFSMNMYLEDNFFSKGMNVSDQTFQSGFFATSAQHTLFLSLYLLNNERKYFSKLDNRMIRLLHSVMGDDVFEVIVNGVKYPNLVKEWLKLRNQGLSKINYEEDVSLSRLFGVFLQQAAILGVYVPYPARMSLFCDERSDTTKRHTLDMIKIVLEVLSSKSQRSYAIDNNISIGYAIWNCHRTSRYLYTDRDKSLIRRLVDHDANLDKLFVIDLSKFENSVRLVYPFVTIMTSPISWPMLYFAHFKIDDPNCTILTYRAKSPTSLNGDGAFLLINQMFFTSDEEHMFKFVEFVKHQDKVVRLKLSSDFLDWKERHTWGFTLGEHLLRFKRLRHLTESRKSELGLGEIEVMVHNLNKYLDSHRVQMSLDSFDQLRKNKITVPSSLMYVNHNRAKIEQSLTVRTETLDERASLDSTFLRHVFSYSIVPKDIEVLKTHALCAIKVRTYSDLKYALSVDGYLPESDDSSFNVILPFLPGYHQSSSYGRLFRYTTLPTVHDRDISGTMGEIVGGLGASFDIDSAIEFGAYVYNINRNLINAAASAIGIPQKFVSKYEQLVQAFIMNNFNLKYHSIFHNAKYFGLSGSLKKFSEYGGYSNKLIRFDTINKMEKFHNAFTRDLVFAYIDELNGRRVYLDYSIHSLLLIMSRGSIKYFTTHLYKLFNPLLSLELD
ncbi:RNA-dependent RNA polymerase [Fiji disease virus]|uniref:RNA-directed RNA polymerase VP1 n=1 Tax=Fiji disease virus (isolate Sugarcane) TaxID=648172 RepID=RDRP_FDVS|nr:RNA-dependent RNA polymerase [Fiji disease virus]Q8JYK1.1 RecName: Full=RNA-directed RNA polymerase VP1 [Fiji disease virus isolate Sugarcane]AAK40249.1 RNA-dependent RNA polymerase [Fiji disease virus]